MRIQPIVEGYGEVAAVPVLLRRLRDEAEAFQIEIASPIRKRRHELITEPLLRKAIRLALLQEGCAAVLILFDSDDDCPKELAPTIAAWAQDEAGPTPCAVVMAVREYEAWLLASLASLRGRRGIVPDAADHPSPEAVRGAKEQISDAMASGRSYSETADQAALTAVFDLSRAYRACRAFRHCVAAFGHLATAMGSQLPSWPPSAWGES